MKHDRRKTMGLLIAGGLLLAGIPTAAYAQDTRLDAQWEEAATAWATAHDQAATAVAEAKGSVNGVADDAAYDPATVSGLRAWVADPNVTGLLDWTPGDRPESASDATRLIGEMRGRTVRLEDAARSARARIVVLRDDIYLKRQVDSRGRLDAKVGEARTVLAESDGNVDDTMVRDRLSALVDETGAADTPLDRETVIARLDTLIGETRRAVTDRAERLAREQAEREAQAAATVTTTTRPAAAHVKETARTANGTVKTRVKTRGAAGASKTVSGSSSNGVASCDAHGTRQLARYCQNAIDRNNTVSIDLGGGSRWVGGHRGKGNAWIDSLNAGDQTQYGKVQWVKKHATAADMDAQMAKSGSGTFLQTCDKDGNPTLVYVAN